MSGEKKYFACKNGNFGNYSNLKNGNKFLIAIITASIGLNFLLKNRH
jgi:hypothetical protein